MTNGDKVRKMTDDELAFILMCPYDTVGAEDEVMPCVKDGTQLMVGPNECHKCSVEWLGREAK